MEGFQDHASQKITQLVMNVIDGSGHNSLHDKLKPQCSYMDFVHIKSQLTDMCNVTDHVSQKITQSFHS